MVRGSGGIFMKICSICVQTQRQMTLLMFFELFLGAGDVVHVAL